MTVYVLFPIILTIAACLAYLFLVGEATLDDIIARWERDRADAAAMRRLERQRAALRVRR